MNIHLPAILGFTRYQGFDPSPHVKCGCPRKVEVQFPAGGAMHLEAMSWSDYRHLLSDLGNEVVQAAPVPYSKNMGLSGGGNGGGKPTNYSISTARNIGTD